MNTIQKMVGVVWIVEKLIVGQRRFVKDVVKFKSKIKGREKEWDVKY